MKHHALDAALDALEGAGEARATTPSGAEVAVEAEAVGPIGVRVRKVRLQRAAPVDLQRECEELPERLRALGERVVPVEVSPVLGGGVLRTRPEDMRSREFYQVEVGPDSAELSRQRIYDEGREEVDFDLTRDQLRRLVDELEG